jgi:hypothetical protein
MVSRLPRLYESQPHHNLHMRANGLWLPNTPSDHVQASPSTGPESVQDNPQEPVAAVEAQATRRVLLKNRKLVAKREYLRLQGSTYSKSGG